MRALVIGSTGLIGRQLLKLLLQDNTYLEVKAISRKPLDSSHAKLENLLVDFDNLADYGSKLNADVVFCCLGTTMKDAGSKEAFKKVDYDYPLLVARVAKASGASAYLLVSALGANRNSSIYYNQIKGEIEAAVEGVGFETYHIFRPSLLLGDRPQKRVGEAAAKAVYKFLGFLIPAKYKAIESIKVARAMLFYGKQLAKGKFIHESGEMQQF